MYFVFSFALLRDSHHERAGGSVSPRLEYGVYWGLVRTRYVARASACVARNVACASCRHVAMSPSRQVASSGARRLGDPVPRPTPPTRDACRTTPGCVQLLTSPVDTHYFLLFLFRSATGYTLRLSVTIERFRSQCGHCRAPLDGVRARSDCMFDRHRGLLQAMFASSIPEIIELVGSRSKYSGELKREHGKRYPFDNIKWSAKVKAAHLALTRNEPPELSATTWNHHLIRKLAQCRQMYCVIYSCARAGPSARGGRRVAPGLRARTAGASGAARRVDSARPCSRLPSVYTECPLFLV